jgi:hypothetical protein
MTAEQRFWSKVRRGDVCWNWTGAIGSGGYGNFYAGGGRTERRTMGAHHYAYELLVGPVPEGKCLDHLCRNRRCVNPDHLEVVTRGENVLRGDGDLARAARASHCKHGHEFTPENTHINAKGWRCCRTCWRRRARESVAREFGLEAQLENGLRRAA